MNTSSTIIESSAKAWRRMASGTRAATACRMTENTGTPSTPPSTNVVTSSTGYGRNGALTQYAASDTPVSSSTGLSPRRSTIRPSIGEPTPMPIVITMLASPAAA